MTFVHKFFHLCLLLKNYFSFHHHIQKLLNQSGIILLMLNPKDLSIINKSNAYIFDNAMMNDDKFKESVENMITSISQSNNIIHSCVNIDKKYYHLSINCVYKKIFFSSKKKYIICLANDITMQVKTHHITYNAYSEQLRINKMKMAFLSRMSHEFRTPLNAVIGFSDAIKHKLYGTIATPYIEYIDNINAAGNHLLDIVNDIMDVSYHETHDIHLNVTHFSPITAVHNILQFIHCLLAKQKISVNLLHDLPNDFMIRNDFNIFKRILINIIGNATKYCPEQTILDITISHSPKDLFIYIRDYGHGFCETVIDNFGVPFNVGNNFLTDTNHSIGLGLSIVKNSVQAMNGIVDIYNHPTGGAVISLQIPIDVTKNNSPQNADYENLLKKAG
jgi:K+-sensing histidine kinase KdpD